MKIIKLALVMFIFNIAMAQDTSKKDNTKWTSARPDGHAPISVMGDHYHHKGEFMFSYRYMPMWMDGNIKEDNSISDSDIYSNFMIAPQEMQMDMHMLGVMYGVSDKLTLMLMGNVLSNTMDLSTMSGNTFTTESEGFGDLKIRALYQLFNAEKQSLHFNMGLSIPTGDIDQTSVTPMSDNAPVAYPMQLGSGTFDPQFGMTYLGQTEQFSWGVQSLYTTRLGTNDNDYRLGNAFETNAWLAYKAHDYFSFSTRIKYVDIRQISGADPAFDPMMMPLFNIENSGRSQVDLGLGANFYVPEGSLKNLRFGFEFILPFYQNVNGIQMENDYAATFGIQYTIE
ncbi:transporter [Flavobacterium sp. CS20]|uniref:transporter n=1 Tax=Flavobacterium sp. CS20 TaxID=2775246 RepID=UPI001B3A19A3|nr:transporter [Flavobacterium sp. CS20]QTY26866.1 transporter [Flavobacterium sp. CS20]